jgi:hypothetical protein
MSAMQPPDPVAGDPVVTGDPIAADPVSAPRLRSIRRLRA